MNVGMIKLNLALLTNVKCSNRVLVTQVPLLNVVSLRMFAAAKRKKDEESNGVKCNYDPAKSNYDAIKDAAWKDGEKVPYIYFATTLKSIEENSSRLKMMEILSNYFWSVLKKSPDDLLPSIYLCLNKLGPSYEGLELGIGESMLIKALADATGRKSEQIKNDIKNKGDLGLVAEASRTTQTTLFQPQRLTVQSVFKGFREIAEFTGHSSANKKLQKIQSLLVACRDCEARYLIRSLAGKLRIGLAEQSLLVALSQSLYLAGEKTGKISRGTDSFKKKVEEISSVLKTVYVRCPNYEKIVKVILEEGWQALPDRCQLTPGIPLQPMLAHPTKGVDEVLRRFNQAKFTCEFKYDGERAQIHVLPDKSTQIFSRNQENNTSKYPDIISRIPEVLKEGVESCILDCEAVAWDRQEKHILPFQVLSTRKRKDATEEDIKVQVCLFAFDLLYLNGESLVTSSFRDRRQKLQDNFNQVEGKFMLATSKDVESTDEIQEFLEESIKGKKSESTSCRSYCLKPKSHLFS